MARITEYRERLKRDGSGHLAQLTDYWSAQDILAAAQGYPWRDRIWNPVWTFWTFLVQVLHAGSSCREAVALVLAEQAGQSPREISPDASAYCQARQRIPASIFVTALHKVGRGLHERARTELLWHGRRIYLVDGSSCSMPDTPSLQEAFGQPDGPKDGCGFPVARLVALFCWSTGAVLDVAIGAYRCSELTLVPALWEHLGRGGIVLADRFYCTYVVLANLLARGCDGVFRLHGARSRTLDFRRGTRLGPDDRQMTWERSTICPRGLSREQWLSLPEHLTIRVLRFATATPGFRSQTIVVATTLLDPRTYPRAEIAALYGDRWMVELRLRDIKTTMQMEVLRGKSPDVVRKEILLHLLAYNLIRALMWQAADKHGRPLHRLSFAGTLAHLNALMPYLWLQAGTRRFAPLHALLLEWIARDTLAYRPGRIEPRAVKRRPKEYDLLNKPRPQLRQALLRKTG
jgi:hypothetical protein